MTATVRGRPRDEEISERALEVTVRLASEGGFAAVSIEKVAREIGCGKAALYRRFPDKSAMIAAAATSRIDFGDAPETGSLEDDLLAHVLVNKRNQERHFGRDGLNRGLSVIFEPTVYPLMWEAVFRRRSAQGALLIEHAIERGDIDAQVDPAALLDTLSGLILYRETIKGAHVDDQQLRTVVQALIAHPPLRQASSGAEQIPNPSGA